MRLKNLPYSCVASWTARLLSAIEAGACWRRPYCSNIIDQYYQQDRLIPWVRQQGSHVGPLELQYNKLNGWTVRTTEAVKAGETLIALPPHLALTSKSAHKSLRLALDRMPGSLVVVTSFIKLALTLLSERAKNDGSSIWWPYIQSLPRRFDRLPLFGYSSDEIQALEDPVLISQLKRTREAMHQITNEILPSLLTRSAPGMASLLKPNDTIAEALAWAMAAATCRSFVGESPGCEAAFLPLVDLCNTSYAPTAIVERVQIHHSPRKKRTATKVEGLEWKLIAVKGLDRGESVDISYTGDLSNKGLLLQFGSVIPKNPYDRVRFPYDGQLLIE